MAGISAKVKNDLIDNWGIRVTFDNLERKIYAHDMGVMPSLVHLYVL